MRISRMLLKTQKLAPVEAELPSHQLSIRAGLAQRLAAGIYSLTPLGYRALQRVTAVVREELSGIGGQEVLLPVVQPAELWQASGRYASIDDTMARLLDRNGHPMVLAMTHEEAAAALAAGFVESYRQLPLLIYQVQTKFRDEPRPRAGLIRLREFMMKDAYSFHTDAASLDETYAAVVEAYRRIFRRLELPVLVVESDTGLMGGGAAHEFMLLAPGGEDTIITCPHCGYAANQEVARFARPAIPPAEPEQVHKIHTPGTKTIAELCELLHCRTEQTLKSVFYSAGGQLVLALVPGNLEVSPVKLSRAVGAEVVTLSPDEASAAGLVVGYAGPVGLKVNRPVLIVADEAVQGAVNLITGANQPDYHLGGVAYGRDFTANLVADIAQAEAGYSCPACQNPLSAARGIEVANTFKLGTRYTEALNAVYTDAAGASRPLWMGCYGIGLTRLLAAAVEHWHDDQGIVWPAQMAPYRYHLLYIGKTAAAREAAEQLYRALPEDEVLYDDRDLSAGVKLKDADLLGMPVRITASDRSLAAGGVEVRLRRTGETCTVAPAAALAEAERLLLQLSN